MNFFQHKSNLLLNSFHPVPFGLIPRSKLNSVMVNKCQREATLTCFNNFLWPNRECQNLKYIFLLIFYIKYLLTWITPGACNVWCHQCKGKYIFSLFHILVFGKTAICYWFQNTLNFVFNIHTGKIIKCRRVYLFVS